MFIHIFIHERKQNGWSHPSLWYTISGNTKTTKRLPLSIEFVVNLFFIIRVFGLRKEKKASSLVRILVVFCSSCVSFLWKIVVFWEQATPMHSYRDVCAQSAEWQLQKQEKSLESTFLFSCIGFHALRPWLKLLIWKLCLFFWQIQFLQKHFDQLLIY